MQPDWLLSLLVSISIGNFPSSLWPWKNAITKLNCYSLVLLGFKLPPFYQVGYALRREKTKNVHSSISVAQVKRLKGAWGKTGLCGGNGRRPRSYLVAPVQQHAGSWQDVHGVQIEGPGRGVVWRFGNFLLVHRRKNKRNYTVQNCKVNMCPVWSHSAFSFPYTFPFPSHSHLWLRHAQPQGELSCPVFSIWTSWVEQRRQLTFVGQLLCAR